MGIFYDGIGDRVLLLRSKAGLSRENLAQLVGITWEELLLIEKSDILPSKDCIDKLANVLHAEKKWLLTERR